MKRSRRAQVLPGPVVELPAVVGAHFQHAGQLLVVEVQAFLEQEHGPLQGGQLGQQQPQAEGEVQLGLQGRQRLHQGLGQVGARARRAALQQREAPVFDRPGQVAFRIPYVAVLAGVPVGQHLLDDVLALAAAARHAVGKGQEGGIVRGRIGEVAHGGLGVLGWGVREASGR